MPLIHPGGSELSPAKRVLLEARLRGLAPQQSRIARRRANTEAPASFAQERFWFVDRIGQGGGAYHSCVPLRLRGALDVQALERALGEIVRRHESLRTTFRDADGTILQVIAPFAGFVLNVEDLSGLHADAREIDVERRVRHEIARPFDLIAGPLCRIVLLRLGPEEHVLVPCVHHIVTDGWSWVILLRELQALYTAYAEHRESPLPDVPIQYGDYAVWERDQWDRDERGRRLLDAWSTRLAGAPTLMALPTDFPRPAEPGLVGAIEEIRWPLAMLERLQALARAERASLYMVLLAGFQVLLGQYTNSDDVIVGAPVAGRTRGDVQNVIGLFVNTLVMRTSLAGDPTFRTVLQRVRDTTQDAYDQQALPFEKLVAELQPKRSANQTPYTHVFFELRNADGVGLSLPGLAVEPVSVVSSAAKFDLALDLAATRDGLAGGLRYRTDLFEGATIRRMVTHFARVLARMTAEPDARLSSLTLLDESERAQVIERFNATAAALPAVCVHELFERQVARAPGAVALVCGDERLTYAELEARANQLAHYLRRLKVGPETRVGLCFERGVDLLVSLLGVLKAGAAYVPLDPHGPAERLTHMLSDSGIAMLLTRDELRAGLPVSTGVHVISVDVERRGIGRCATTAPVSGVTGDNLCYVIYTSGSTGRPKGVAVHHRGVANYIDWALRTYRVGEGHGAPVFSSLSVDLTVTSLLPLFAGQFVWLLPEEHPIEALADVLRTRPGFGVIKITPLHLSLLAARLTADEARGAAHTLVVGGEVLDAATTRFWQDHAPDAAIVNEYGPTETVVGCTAYVVPPGRHRDGPVPVGVPIQNLRNYVLDAQGEPLPIGVPGELFIGGAGVARGYLGRPGLTAERFVPDPFAAPGARMYRSGDRARWRSDGTLTILGRTDRQVKVRGFRVELGEVEAVMRRHASLRDCLAMCREDRPGDQRLAVYVVGDATDAELRAHAQRTLPEYMVPSAFVRIEALPLTPTGKLDAKALPAPAYPAADPVLDTPQDYVEVQLIHIWEQLLGVPLIGPTQDFFELGGNSLLALHLFAQIKRKLQCTLPLGILVTGATVRQMAAAIRQQRASAASPGPIVPLQPEGDRPPLFCVHPAGRGVSVYVHLVRHLGPRQPVFGVLDLDENLARPVSRIAAEHISAIRARQPDGPYYLLGWSFGGTVVYEMAVQLARQHQEVAFVGVVDTIEIGLSRALPKRDAAWRVAVLAKEIAEKMGRPFSLRREELHALDLHAQCRYAADALHAQHAAPPDFTAATLREDYYDVVVLRERSRRRHKPRPYAGRLTLFRPLDTPDDYARLFSSLTEEEARTLGWSRCAASVAVERVPGTHRAMFCEPHVRVLAQRVRECLADAAARHEAHAEAVGNPV
jgi:amino acid adenylation domain-containing protein